MALLSTKVTTITFDFGVDAIESFEQHPHVFYSSTIVALIIKSIFKREIAYSSLELQIF